MGKKKSLHSAIDFTRGQGWAHYVKSMSTNGAQMEGMLHSAMQTEVDLTRFEAAVAAHGGEIARFMERGKAAGEEFDAAVAEFGNPDDLMGAKDPETRKKGMELLGKIGQRMQVAHERHVWRDTAAEWSELLA